MSLFSQVVTQEEKSNSAMFFIINFQSISGVLKKFTIVLRRKQ